MTDGFSLWLLLIVAALGFVVLWGLLAALIAMGTWFIARNKLPDDDRPRGPADDWDVPIPRDDPHRPDRR